MNEDGPLFILAGNGPYANRGCEAIVRGTVKILRMYFRDPRFVCLSHFRSKDQYRMQRLEEKDDAITHLTWHGLDIAEITRNLWKPEIWKAIYKRLHDKNTFYSQTYREMIPYFNEAACVLSIGGDNYSLDYGLPTSFTALDDLAIEYKKPIFLWGASVGPFSIIPDYERYMSGHLQKVTGIFARESVTVEYLHGIGITKNVYTVSDPAFLMDAEQPKETIPIENGAIGLNFSSLMAKYITNGDVEKWANIAASIIAEIAERTESHVYLIPHVMNPNSDDHLFMERALSLVPRKTESITLVGPKFNAAETKWIISRMALFAGARTHSTIAALSSGVPTISFAYSIKARGINRDIFGHLDYCISPKDLGARSVSDRIISMLANCSDIKMELREQIPRIQKLAQYAGSKLDSHIGCD